MNPGGVKNFGAMSVSEVTSFLRAKVPYFLGLCVVEAGLYYFDGPTGNFTTGLLGLFMIWIYYSWISKK
jgi:hypothetical protein